MTIEETKALEEEKKAEMIKTAESLKKEMGLDDILARLDAAEKKVADNVMKVFVGKDVQKDVAALSDDEKVKAFAIAIARADEVSLKALSEGVDADGGYVVPAPFHSSLIEGLITASKFRSLVNVITMTSRTLVLDSIINGPDVYWTGEGVTKTTTSAEFSQATLTAFKLASIIYLTDELLDDSRFDLSTILINRFAKKIAEAEDTAILNGNGTTAPQGLFVASTGVSTVDCSGNLDEDDIINLTYLLPEEYRANARFLVNDVNVKELRKLKDSTGRYLWASPTAPNQSPTMQGYPVTADRRVREDQILFGDLKEAYWLGDRQRMTVKITQDTETAFTKDMTGIRVVERVGGFVVIPGAIVKIINIP